MAIARRLLTSLMTSVTLLRHSREVTIFKVDALGN